MSILKRILTIGLFASVTVNAQEINLKNIDPLDFFIQDVCIDKNNQTIMGASPLDSRCVSTRDLTPRERLTYHRIEYPGVTLAAELAANMAQSNMNPVPNGSPWSRVTRFDNIPMNLATGLGIGAVAISDNQVNGQFWTFNLGPDTIHGPDLKSKESVYRAFSLDHSGPYRQISANCRGQITDALSTLNGNYQIPLVDGNFTGALSGETELPAYKYVDYTGPCPNVSGSGGTLLWAFEYLKFSVGVKVNQDLTKPILTLRLSNAKDYRDSHVEPTFYAREFGQVRHESWNNLNHKDWAEEKDKLRSVAAEIISEKKCASPEPKPPFDLRGWRQDKSLPGQPWISPEGHPWVMTSCRQTVTTISAYDTVNGDNPRVFRDPLEKMELSAKLFGLPLPPKPVMTSFSRNSGPGGTKVVLTGKNFAAQDNMIIFDRGCTENRLPSANDGKTIEFTVPEVCGRKNIEPGDYQVLIFNGQAVNELSNSLIFRVTP